MLFIDKMCFINDAEILKIINKTEVNFSVKHTVASSDCITHSDYSDGSLYADSRSVSEYEALLFWYVVLFVNRAVIISRVQSITTAPFSSARAGVDMLFARERYTRYSRSLCSVKSSSPRIHDNSTLVSVTETVVMIPLLPGTGLPSTGITGIIGNVANLMVLSKSSSKHDCIKVPMPMIKRACITKRTDDVISLILIHIALHHEGIEFWRISGY